MADRLNQDPESVTHLSTLVLVKGPEDTQPTSGLVLKKNQIPVTRGVNSMWQNPTYNPETVLKSQQCTGAQPIQALIRFSPTAKWK